MRFPRGVSVERARAGDRGDVDASYDHTETIDSEVTTLNATSSLFRADLARRRADGSEIGRLGVTYLITIGPAGRRIVALTVHPP
jgi:hypothetical protein